MTVQLELFRPEEMAPDNPSTRLVTITRPSEIKMPLSLAAEFADAGERVRIGLQNASAHLIEIGHELRLIKELLTRGEFVRAAGFRRALRDR